MPYIRGSMHFIIILIALSLIGDCEPDEIVAWDVPRRFCSSDIPNIMRLVCRRRTRNLPLIWNKNAIEKQYNINHRPRRGIVDDCCKQPCTPMYIQEYCHSDFEKTSHDVVLLYTSRREYTISTTTTTKAPTTSTTTVAPAPLRLHTIYISKIMSCLYNK
ncbi:bombyxin B-8-like, partial [Aphis craccivora]